VSVRSEVLCSHSSSPVLPPHSVHNTASSITKHAVLSQPMELVSKPGWDSQSSDGCLNWHPPATAKRAANGGNRLVPMFSRSIITLQVSIRSLRCCSIEIRVLSVDYRPVCNEPCLLEAGRFHNPCMLLESIRRCVWAAAAALNLPRPRLADGKKVSRGL
jgi:hypothetical protein